MNLAVGSTSFSESDFKQIGESVRSEWASNHDEPLHCRTASERVGQRLLSEYDIPSFAVAVNEYQLPERLVPGDGLHYTTVVSGRNEHRKPIDVVIDPTYDQFENQLDTTVGPVIVTSASDYIFYPLKTRQYRLDS